MAIILHNALKKNLKLDKPTVELVTKYITLSCAHFYPNITKESYIIVKQIACHMKRDQTTIGIFTQAAIAENFKAAYLILKVNSILLVLTCNI